MACLIPDDEQYPLVTFRPLTGREVSRTLRVPWENLQWWDAPDGSSWYMILQPVKMEEVKNLEINRRATKWLRERGARFGAVWGPVVVRFPGEPKPRKPGASRSWYQGKTLVEVFTGSALALWEQGTDCRAIRLVDPDRYRT